MNSRVVLLIVIVLSLATGCLTSCLKDDPCRFGMSVTVYAENDYQKVNPVVLYIFNSDETFREKLTSSFISGNNFTTFSLNHLPNGNYKLVAWGNEDGNQVMPEFASGKGVQDATATLLDEDEMTCCTTDELFYGYKEINRDNSHYNQEKMSVARSIGGLVVSVVGASEESKATDEYQVVVKGTLYSFPFMHELTTGGNYLPDGDKEANYRLALDWKKSVLSSGLRYIFPSGISQKLSLALYQNGKLLKEYTPDVHAPVNKIVEIKLNVGTAGDWFQVVDWHTIGQDEEL